MTVSTWSLGATLATYCIKAPYYACKIIQGTTGAFGGMIIDQQCHVIDYNGNPIPHLFAAGNCSSGWLGDFYYGSGTCLMACAALPIIHRRRSLHELPCHSP